MTTNQRVIKVIDYHDQQFPDHLIVEHVCPTCGTVHTTKEAFMISPREWEEQNLDPTTFNIDVIEAFESYPCGKCEQPVEPQAPARFDDHSDDPDWCPF